MAQQEDGWPLGLQPLNLRVGLIRNRDLSGSVSCSTLLTDSSSSSVGSSSDLDTESTGSFFHDKSITLGSLIGISSILEFSRRSTRGRTAETLRDKKSCKSKTWFFSLCSKLNTDAVSMNTTPSLGHFLEAERRAASLYRRTQSPSLYGPDEFSKVPVSDPSWLFVSVEAAPPRPSSPLDSNGERRSNRGLIEQGNGYGVPLLFSCLRGQLIE